MSTIRCDIVSAEQEIFRGEATLVVATGELGELGIAPKHAPLITRLKPGKVVVTLASGEQLDFAISGGILEVQPQVVTVLADTAVRASDIDEAQVRLLEENMEHFAKVSNKLFGFDLPSIKHGGAAGGVAATLAAYLNAELVPGTEYLMGVVGMAEKVAAADFVFTAEGRLDEQTLKGKGPHGLALLANENGKPVVCFTGAIQPGFNQDNFPMFQAVVALPNRPMSLNDSMANAAELLEYQAMQVARLLGV